MKSNPLTAIVLMVRASRPSHTSDMPARPMPFWIGRGYDGLTFFGHIFTHTQQEADAFNNHFDAMKNHEMIHLYQARSTHDSWLCFYWLYFVYWLKASRYRRRLRNAGYRLNPFEMEAYANMADLTYLQPGGQATEWRRYAAMSLEERLKLLNK
jgi:hypothetical protein